MDVKKTKKTKTGVAFKKKSNNYLFGKDVLDNQERLEYIPQAIHFMCMN